MNGIDFELFDNYFERLEARVLLVCDDASRNFDHKLKKHLPHNFEVFLGLRFQENNSKDARRKVLKKA